MIHNDLNKLIEGNKRFVNSSPINHNVGVSINSSLTTQNPFAIILTCSDSRVGVNIIFDTKLGDLFIIKNAGNIVDMSTLATIEFAVAKLNVSLIVVLSHQSCGAVDYAITTPKIDTEREKNFNFLLQQIRTIASEDKNQSAENISKKNAAFSKQKIIQDSMIIAEKIEKKELNIVTAFYKISTGKVTFY